jgi:rare lipoprotein A
LPTIALKPSLTAVLLSMAICTVRAEEGMASFYGGGRTASGEVTGPAELTAAHRTLAFGTMVLVTNIGNGRTVTVPSQTAVLMAVDASSTSAVLRRANSI